MRKLCAWLGVATLFVMMSTAASQADVLKPYVVFMLDTSGSMNFVTQAGPPSCGGRDNRLNHAKCAINRIVNSYGDMVFALGRFRMSSGGSFAGSCDANGDVAGGGGDDCTSGALGCSSSVGDGGGEMLTGLVDGGNQAAATWTDFQCGTCGGAGTSLTSQPEIWAANGGTPLGGYMASASLYWRGIATSTGSPTYTIWPSTGAGFDPIRNDPTNLQFLPTGCDPSATCTTNCCAEQCRSYITIMLTDGDETCDGNAETPISGMLQTIVDNRKYRIETKVIGFGVPVGDADIERYAQAGGAVPLPGVNEGYYANDEASLQLAISQILADAVKFESCNNLDDDCDSKIDEDFKPPLMVPGLGDSCDNGQQGECRQTGSWGCSADGSGIECSAQPVAPGNEGTTCNGKDDDCDGKIDETLGCTPCPATGETCNGIDDDCDGVIDQICRCSNDNTLKCDADSDCGAGNQCNCQPLVRDCANTVPNVGSCPGTQQCIGANMWGACSAQTPMADTCDGLDNNCDGVCDGLQAECSEVNGPCNPNNGSSCPGTDNPGDPGHWPNPDAPETACGDQIDNDLDGLVNDGCPALNAPETACSDAMDNDGDGVYNDGCPVPTLPIPQNICRPGTRVCPAICNSNGNSYGSCAGELKPLPNDPCNGLDDDCDNKIDEDYMPQPCESNCGVGTTKCVNGTITCDSPPASPDDNCDGIDQDCDGTPDDDWACPVPLVNNKCPCVDPNVCDGDLQCISGQEQCVGPAPGIEVCNCQDDDCDNQIDEDPDPNDPNNNLCPGESVCSTSCHCAFPCTPGEFPCPLGKKCENNLCVNDPCFGVTCGLSDDGNAQTCVPKPGAPNEAQCVEICTVTQCGANQVCVPMTGECKADDCTTFPERCSSSQVCIVNSNGLGECVTNPCVGVTCAADEYCIGGVCVSSCADITCPTGQRCRQGMCETDPCGEMCPFGYACNDVTGECIEDPCKFRECGQGQWCNPNDGQCEADPCVVNAVTCPNEGEVCRGGSCVDPDSLRPDAAGAAHVTVGGGGGCSTNGGTSTLLVGLALLLMRRRKRVRAERAAGGNQ